MGKDDCTRKHPVDQVSRIMHAQHAMKHFLGALGKPAMPQPPAAAAAKRQHHKAPERATPVHAERAPPPAAHVTVSHTSFRLRISDPSVNVRCSACARPHRSSSLAYIHMPTLAKPWIPICPACHRASSR